MERYGAGHITRAAMCTMCLVIVLTAFQCLCGLFLREGVCVGGFVGEHAVHAPSFDLLYRARQLREWIELGPNQGRKNTIHGTLCGSAVDSSLERKSLRARRKSS